MREILFRQYFYKGDTFLGRHEWGYTSNGVFESPATWGGSTHFINKQYIGLTDKNGVKIFEGDLVFLEDGEHSFYGKIIFEYGQFIAVSINGLDPVLSEDIESLKVIGNAHDNLELLDK